MLSKRIVSSALLISLIWIAIFNRWLFAAMMLSLTCVGLWEFFTILQKNGIAVQRYFGTAAGMTIPVSLLLGFEAGKGGELLFLALTLLLLMIIQFTRKDNSGAVIEVSATFFGVIYVSWLFSFIIKVRQLPAGAALLGLLLLATKLADIGAYLVGSRFGKTPLIPQISPKKSREGSLGGILFSTLGALVMKPFLSFSYAQLIFIGLFLGTLSQLGDLAESLIKRDCQVKDAGRAFPGLGGVLDSIDSLLFTAPVFYFYIQNLLR